MIVIVDYGMGNTGSILNMLKVIGVDATLAADPQSLQAADKLILPGVGAFDAAMTKLHDLDILPLLTRRVKEEKVPILGICLGMQLFADRSEEGEKPGFGWIPGQVKKFVATEQQPDLKVPHMGWNVMVPTKASPIFKEIFEPSRFYFVHSYYYSCADARDELARTHYGLDFVSAVQRENIIGLQFHPEKSHKFGMRVLENFARYC